jgi:hypothetical protein
MSRCTDAADCTYTWCIFGLQFRRRHLYILADMSSSLVILSLRTIDKCLYLMCICTCTHIHTCIGLIPTFCLIIIFHVGIKHP